MIEKLSMEFQSEKVYVAVGKDFQEGTSTLDWVLKNWASQAITIVILHVSNNSKDLVSTPFGKLPASSINDGKMEAFRMCEQEKTDKLLSKYLAYCGKVRTEILKIEKSEDPVHKVIVGLISTLCMRKLVMGTSARSLSRNARTGITGSFYVYKHKPDFCELFVASKGRLVLLRDGKDEGSLEMKEKGGFKVWWGKLLTDNASNYVGSNSERGYSRHVLSSLTSSDICDDHEKWENCTPEIENYFNWLTTSNLNSREHIEEDNGAQPGHMELPDPEDLDPNLSYLDKIEVLKAKLEEAQRTVEEKRNEVKVNQERRRRAEWAISVCHKRVEEMESLSREEITKQVHLQTTLNALREQLEEASNDFEEHKNRMKSLRELEGELLNKLQASSLEKLHIETQLEMAMKARTETQRQIEMIRQQTDDLRRKIAFCRGRKATGGMNKLAYSYQEFTDEELREATENFSAKLKVGEGANGVVYRGKLNHTTVAVKLHNSFNEQSKEEFQAEINLLCEIRHPHLISMIGACPEKKCIVLEFMHNGSLEQSLFPNATNHRNNPLPWFTRVRIAAEICSGLVFLHTTRPKPTVHCDLKPANVLLDRNFVTKIADFGLSHRLKQDLDYSKTSYGDSKLKGTINYMDPDYLRTGEFTPRSDVYSLGIIMLQLLTGKSVFGLVQRVQTALEYEDFAGILDKTAGNWPADQAMKFASIAMRCADVSRKRRPDAHPTLMTELEELRKAAIASEILEGGGWNSERVAGDGARDSGDVPSIFICPIFQEIMKDPHVAADGFSYELEAIQEWLGSGHQTSPMTNSKLKHRLLTPNHTLRSLISDWHKSTAYNR